MFSNLLSCFISSFATFQVGDFILLHLLGQNMNLLVFGEILDELVRRLNFESNSNLPTAPSTMEMSPIYPNMGKFAKEMETWSGWKFYKNFHLGREILK